VGLIGAGSFAQNFLIPGLRGLVELKGLTTNKPNLAKHIATQFGFGFCSGDTNDIFNNPEINTVVIATRHDSHGSLVVRALESRKNVYTEKPLCLTQQELETIRTAYNGAGVSLLVGFNRRFAPLIQTLKKNLNSEVPCTINYRVNAGPVPKEHWIHHPRFGGGRLLGEGCHFIDLCSYLTGSPVSKVSAQAMKDSSGLNDTFTVQLAFENGSLAVISYFSNGNTSIGKERIEIFNGGVTGIIDDFMELQMHMGGKSQRVRSKQDKGHRSLLESWSQSLKNGNACPIPFEEIHNSTLATILSNESLTSMGEILSLSTHG
jgi:polar amino acid transport system substrate-binding protein